MLSAEEPRVQGPGPRTNHRQACAKDRQYGRKRCAARERKSGPRSHNRHQNSGHRSPQTGQKQNSSERSYTLRHDGSANRRCIHAGNAAINLSNPQQQPLR